jgi:hypothetical protein
VFATLRTSYHTAVGASKYDLVANIVHDGKAGQGQGAYRVHVQRKVEETWWVRFGWVGF